MEFREEFQEVTRFRGESGTESESQSSEAEVGEVRPNESQNSIVSESSVASFRSAVSDVTMGPDPI